jgi:hypothetical protein
VNRLWRIIGPNFVAGLVVKDGKVIETAPILKRYLGGNWHRVRLDLIRRGHHGEIVDHWKEKE